MNRFHLFPSFSHCWHKLTTVYDYVDVLPALYIGFCCRFYLLLSLLSYIFPHIRWISTIGSTTRPNKKQTNKLARTTAATHFVMIYHRTCILHFSILRSAFQEILMILVGFYCTIFAASQSATNMNWKEGKKVVCLLADLFATTILYLSQSQPKHLWINGIFRSLFGTTTNYGLYVSISMGQFPKSKSLLEKI